MKDLKSLESEHKTSEPFGIDDYLSDVHRENPGTVCAFSALAPEIARSDKRTRALTLNKSGMTLS